MKKLINVIALGLFNIGNGLSQLGSFFTSHQLKNDQQADSQSDFEKTGDDLRLAIKKFDKSLEKSGKN